MRILVTGSEGALMQAVIPRLLEKGHSVLGVDNFARYGEIERDRAYDFVRGDLTDASFAENVTRGVDHVIQAAALLYGIGGYHKYAADILSKDITLHQNILWGMLKNSVKRIAYISSSMVYERSDKHPSEEPDLLEAKIPSTDYALSKVVGERLVHAFSRQYGVQYVIWRPFNVINPNEEGEAEIGISHVFADFMRTIVIDGKTVLPLIGDGEQIRSFTWIGDVARAIADHSFSDETLNGTFNLGNPEPMTMKDLAQMIYSLAVEDGLIAASPGGLKFETTRSYDDDIRVRIPDSSRAKDTFGWEPTMKTADAVRECLAVLAAKRGAVSSAA